MVSIIENRLQGVKLFYIKTDKATVAQLVERLTRNEVVHGSSPCSGFIFEGEKAMGDEKEIIDYFECKRCGNKEFRPVYTFSLRFHTVNFSDDLIYERVNEERFECTGCNTKYTKDEIAARLRELKRKRRGVMKD